MQHGPGQGYGHGQPAYGNYGPPPQPPKKGMSTGLVLLIVFGALFGTCMTCGVISGASKKTKDSTAAADPSAETARRQQAQKAADEAKATRERIAVESLPTKKIDIAAALKRAAVAADASKWAQASTELTAAETDLASFEGTSVATDKELVELQGKAATLHKRIAPQAEKIAHAAAAASAEKELAASSVVVSSLQLWNDYQANEVSADFKYKGKKLLVTGTVQSIDKGPFGGLILRLAVGNEFMSTMCDMEKSEQSDLAQLSKGERVRVLCTGRGMVIGSPSLDDCTFR